MNITDIKPVYRYAAQYRSNYDGDTIRVDINLGFGIWARNQVIRLYGVNTPELRGGTDTTKEHGRMAKEFVQKMLEDHELVLETKKDKKGKYGRWLGIIWVRYADEKLEWVSLNESLLTEGYSKEYMKE